jgi:hypothetical protein
MNKARFWALLVGHVLLTASSLAESAVTLQVEVINSTTIFVSFSGTIVGPVASTSGTLLVDTSVSSEILSSALAITGNAMLGPQPLYTAYSGFNNAPYGGTLQFRNSLNGEIQFVAGDVLSGSATITFDSNHGLTQDMFDGTGAPIYLGGAGTFQGYAVTPTDTDADGVPDSTDNCIEVPNASQCDSDGDGYGNHCDGDLNNNGFTNAQDYILFRTQLGQSSVAPTYNQADLNCNGFVNSQDYVVFRSRLGVPSGPSGLVP